MINLDKKYIWLFFSSVFVRINNFLAFLVQKTFKKIPKKNSHRLLDIFVVFCDNFHMLKLVKNEVLIFLLVLSYFVLKISGTLLDFNPNCLMNFGDLYHLIS